MMGLFTTMKKFKNQDYDKLKKKCQQAGVLFTDSEFPAAQRAISPSGSGPADVVWKRPHEMCEQPRLFVDGVSTGDVTQGQLGNCWFVAACSVLAGVKVLWHKVIPDYEDQEFSDENPKNYAGIFHFRFWRFGEWMDIVIDDLLPTVNGRLIYTHSRERNEFWSALLEKAYAKINTSYESLDGGNLCDALVDFTSGVSATIDLVEGGYRSDETKKTQLFKELRREMDDHALMCAAVAARSKDEVEQRTEMGLIKGHAYGITAIKKVPIGNTTLVTFFTGREKVYMVRLRNPWGEKEWSGAFSDGGRPPPPPPRVPEALVARWREKPTRRPPMPPASQLARHFFSPPPPLVVQEKQEKTVFALPSRPVKGNNEGDPPGNPFLEHDDHGNPFLEDDDHGNPFFEDGDQRNPFSEESVDRGPVKQLPPAALATPSAPPVEKHSPGQFGSPSVSELFNSLDEGDVILPDQSEMSPPMGAGITPLEADLPERVPVRLPALPHRVAGSNGQQPRVSGPSSHYLYSTQKLALLSRRFVARTNKNHWRSPEWSKITDSEREKIGLTFDNDGEFWMTFDDFVIHFTDVSVCQLINTSFFSFSKTWCEEREFGGWTPGAKGVSLDRAGGCLNNRSTFLHNPQYRFDVEAEVDEVIVQLSQKDQRERKHEGATNLCIGFHVMKVELNRKYRVHRIQESAATSDYIRSRSIFWREQLPRGRYVLVPTTFSPAESGQFLLRVFMDSSPNLKEVTKEQPKPSWFPCVPTPHGVVVVKVVSGTGLEKQDSLGSADPYVIIKCGKTSVRSYPVKENLNPIWNCKAIFYRQPAEPCKIQVWNSCLLKDKFMGQATLMAENSPGNVVEYELNLFGKSRSDATERRPGKLTIEVIADSDMTAV